jgi:hypothetical protein
MANNKSNNTDDNYLLIEKEITVVNDILIRLIDLPMKNQTLQQSAILNKLKTTELNIHLFLQSLGIQSDTSTK